MHCALVVILRDAMFVVYANVIAYYQNIAEMNCQGEEEIYEVRYHTFIT